MSPLKSPFLALSAASIVAGCAQGGLGQGSPPANRSSSDVLQSLLQAVPQGVSGSSGLEENGTLLAANSGAQEVDFTFNAFGDAGWADTHVARPGYGSGFKKAYLRFDPKKSLIGDINYINWETSVGRVCSSFWSPASGSTYAFLTRPEELKDAVGLGFNLIGLANNHSYDCLSSPEGNGPLQTLGHINQLRHQLQSSKQTALFSGVFQSPDQEAPAVLMPTPAGEVPVRFLSAYVGGDASHCRFILCDKGLERYAKSMATQPGLRVLALHSWDPSSHRRLQSTLRSWIARGLVDVAIGSGPHVAERVAVLSAPRGSAVLATSLGNFIHPSLASQPNNIVLRTAWKYDAGANSLRLRSLRATTVACRADMCRQTQTKSYTLPQPSSPSRPRG